MANTTHHSPSPGKKVLSLDGGGVRGLSSLLILRHLMKELGLKLQPPKPDLKPCEYFDLIGGTSTGGIIALMLGRLRMSVQECIDEYTALSRHIFKRKRHLGSSGPTFYAEDLEKALKKVIGERLGLQNEEAPLRDPLGEEACKTFVVTLQNQHAKSAQRLRTYPSGSEVPCTIWQAARATSAASTFFESITFGNPAVEWIDAGLGYNNPAEEVLDEAQILWEDDDGGFDAKRQIGVFVSLGTGIPEVFRPEKEKSFPRTILDDIAKRAGIPPDVIKQMKDIVTDSEKVHGRMIPRFRGPGRDNYYRFNVDSLGNIGLGDYEREEIMTVDTNAYLQRETYRMRDCTILMKKFPVYETLLNRNVDEVELEGTVGQTIALGLFQNTKAKLENTRELACIRSTAVLDTLVCAHILDHQARKRLTKYYKSHMAPNAESSNDTVVIVRHVEAQMESNRDLWAAYQHYRKARASLHSLSLDDSSFRVSYYLCTHRLAGVSESFGLLSDAMRLFQEAFMGRTKELLKTHESTQRSLDGLRRVAEMIGKGGIDT